MRRTLAISFAVFTLVALAAGGALLALGAVARSHATCGKVDPSALRRAGDPRFAAQLERLARCER